MNICCIRWTTSGFSLIELLVTISVVAIMLGLAVPTFSDVREKSIVRGAAGDLLALVTQAKLEAAKRNDFVTVSVRGSGSSWCVGLQTGLTGCNCANTTCNVSQLGATAYNGARLLAAANFGGTPTTDFSIDPRMGMLRGMTGGGSLVVRSPSDGWDYRVQFTVTATAQASLCAPTGGKHSLSDYPPC
jgi:type IV fimbrial biogenesis protein FimT